MDATAIATVTATMAAASQSREGRDLEAAAPYVAPRPTAHHGAFYRLR
jgi:hypothetical protein